MAQRNPCPHQACASLHSQTHPLPPGPRHRASKSKAPGMHAADTHGFRGAAPRRLQGGAVGRGAQRWGGFGWWQWWVEEHRGAGLFPLLSQPRNPPATPTSHLQPFLRTYAAEKAQKDPEPLPRGPRWLVAHQRRLEERRPSVGYVSSWYRTQVPHPYKEFPTSRRCCTGRGRMKTESTLQHFAARKQRNHCSDQSNTCAYLYTTSTGLKQANHKRTADDASGPGPLLEVCFYHCSSSGGGGGRWRCRRRPPGAPSPPLLSPLRCGCRGRGTAGMADCGKAAGAPTVAGTATSATSASIGGGGGRCRRAVPRPSRRTPTPSAGLGMDAGTGCASGKEPTSWSSLLPASTSRAWTGAGGEGEDAGRGGGGGTKRGAGDTRKEASELPLPT